MYNNVGWLSRGLDLIPFVECLNEIMLLLNDQRASCQELSNDNLVCKLMLFADFCEHLNVKLQSSGGTLDVTFGYIKAFEKKLEVFMRDVDDE